MNSVFCSVATVQIARYQYRVKPEMHCTVLCWCCTAVVLYFVDAVPYYYSTVLCCILFGMVWRVEESNHAAASACSHSANHCHQLCMRAYSADSGNQSTSVLDIPLFIHARSFSHIVIFFCCFT